MIGILHYFEDPKLWGLWYITYAMGNAGFISSADTAQDVQFTVQDVRAGLRIWVCGFRTTPQNPKPQNPNLEPKTLNQETLNPKTP